MRPGLADLAVAGLAGWAVAVLSGAGFVALRIASIGADQGFDLTVFAMMFLLTTIIGGALSFGFALLATVGLGLALRRWSDVSRLWVLVMLGGLCALPILGLLAKWTFGDWATSGALVVAGMIGGATVWRVLQIRARNSSNTAR